MISRLLVEEAKRRGQWESWYVFILGLGLVSKSG